jgi:tyrosyl-tRNA synthetase
MPKAFIAKDVFEKGLSIADLFVKAALCLSKSEARRLAEQGGAFVQNKNGEFTPVNDPGYVIDEEALNCEGSLVVRKGKKNYCLIVTRRE